MKFTDPYFPFEFHIFSGDGGGEMHIPLYDAPSVVNAVANMSIQHWFQNSMIRSWPLYFLFCMADHKQYLQ